MKKLIIVLLMLGLICSLCGCTAQYRARTFGGTVTLYLEPNQKLEEITWKEESLWYLTRPMTEGDIATTHKFQESDSLGIMEGTVFVVETKFSDTELAAYNSWKEEHRGDIETYLNFISGK